MILCGDGLVGRSVGRWKGGEIWREALALAVLASLIRLRRRRADLLPEGAGCRRQVVRILRSSNSDLFRAVTAADIDMTVHDVSIWNSEE
jgi:hypothetical protein